MDNLLIVSYTGGCSKEFLVISTFFNLTGTCVYEIRMESDLKPTLPREIADGPRVIIADYQIEDSGDNSLLLLKKRGSVYYDREDRLIPNDQELLLVILTFLRKENLAYYAEMFHENQLFAAFYTSQCFQWTIPDPELITSAMDSMTGCMEKIKRKRTMVAQDRFLLGHIALAYDKIARYNSGYERILFSPEAISNDLMASVEEDKTLWRAYFDLGDLNYTFHINHIDSNLYYKKCQEYMDYHAVYKQSFFWRNINKSPENEKHCLDDVLRINSCHLESLYNYGAIAENAGKYDQALQAYQKAACLLERRDTCLQVNEFKILCNAYKQIGCMLYKQKNDYEGAVDYYFRTFELFNRIPENKLADELEPYFTKQQYYTLCRKSVDMRKVVGSIAKIFNLMGDSRREETYENLWRGMADEIEIPVMR